MDEKEIYTRLIECLANGNILKFGQIIESIPDEEKRAYPTRHECFLEIFSLVTDLEKIKGDEFGMNVENVSQKAFGLLQKMIEGGNGLTAENMRPYFLILGAFLQIIMSNWKTQLIALQFFSQAFFQTEEGKRYIQAWSFLQTPGASGLENVQEANPSSKLKH